VASWVVQEPESVAAAAVALLELLAVVEGPEQVGVEPSCRKRNS
jgi:hypothetical protein